MHLQQIQYAPFDTENPGTQQGFSVRQTTKYQGEDNSQYTLSQLKLVTIVQKQRI